MEACDEVPRGGSGHPPPQLESALQAPWRDAGLQPLWHGSSPSSSSAQHHGIAQPAGRSAESSGTCGPAHLSPAHAHAHGWGQLAPVPPHVGAADEHSTCPPTSTCPTSFSRPANAPAAAYTASSMSAASSADGRLVVFVWDLDETLILFNSLLNGTYAEALRHAEAPSCPGHQQFAQQQQQQQRAQELKEIGDEVMDLVFMLADSFMQYKQLEALDPVHLEDVLTPAQLHTPRTSASPSPPCRSPVRPPHALPPLPPQHQQQQQQQQQGEAGHISSPPDSPHTKRQRSASPVPVSHSAPCTAREGYTSAGGCTSSPQACGTGGERALPPACFRALPPGMHGSRSGTMPGQKGALSEGFAALQQTYEGGMGSLPLSASQRQHLQQLMGLKFADDGAGYPSGGGRLGASTGGWASHAAALLKGLSMEGAARGVRVEHYLVTAGQLVATLAKLMLFDLDSFFAPDHVYSASRQTKLHCFQRIRRAVQRKRAAAQQVQRQQQAQAERQHPQQEGEDDGSPKAAGQLASGALLDEGLAGVSFVAVGDGVEERRASQIIGWPCVRIKIGPRAASCRSEGGADPGFTIFDLTPDVMLELALTHPA